MSAALAEVELRRVRLELRQPHAAGHATIGHREVVLVHVTLDDGTEGWGECAALERPTYTAETTDGAWTLLHEELVPAALAGDADRIVGHPMARGALLDARLDADLRRTGTPLAEALLAGMSEVPATRVIGIAGSIDELLAEVAEAPGRVKLKIAPGWDLEPLGAVRRAFPDRWMAADANGGYAVDDLERLATLDALDLTYLEQPLPGITAAADAGPHLRTPIVLDEPVGSLDTVRAAVALGHLGGLNLKPGKGGGILATAQAMSWAAGAGVGVLCGGMLETGVGRAGAVALAALDSCTLPTDLGPSERYFTPDLTDPITALPNGDLVVPTGPGIGAVPDADRLDAATVDRAILRR